MALVLQTLPPAAQQSVAALPAAAKLCKKQQTCPQGSTCRQLLSLGGSWGAVSQLAQDD
jgi:hypothetical protein